MVIVTAVREWSCPNCKQTDTTNEARPHTRFHSCSGLNGLTAPMIEGKAKVTVVERGDYIGSDKAGRVMAIVTERSDGSNDVAVFAPTAVATAKEL